MRRERVDEEAEWVVETRSRPRMYRVREISCKGEKIRLWVCLCPRAGKEDSVALFGDKKTQPGRRVVGESLVQSPTSWPASPSNDARRIRCANVRLYQCLLPSISSPLFFPANSSAFFPSTCRTCPLLQTRSRGSSTHTPKMAAQFSPSQVQTLPSSLVIPVKARATASRLATPPKYSACSSFFFFSPERNQASIDATFRTDRAVLAVNGFAADGNMFVKKVKQRLEVYSVR